nr:MAG TPA: hypothetical protein [Caudoviricetes sp.]
MSQQPPYCKLNKVLSVMVLVPSGMTTGKELEARVGCKSPHFFYLDLGI